MIPQELRKLGHVIEINLGPRPSGIYFLCSEGKIVYVGKSVSVVSRVATHREDPSKVFDRAFYVEVPECDLEVMEAELIHWFRPKFNKSIPVRRQGSWNSRRKAIVNQVAAVLA